MLMAICQHLRKVQKVLPEVCCLSLNFGHAIIWPDQSITDILAMEHLSARDCLTVQQRIRLRFQHYAALFMSIILTATASMLQAIYIKEPYHTSILTGEGWVMELLARHPERIRCELGVRHHVFAELIAELRAMGYTNSKYVSLEEQLAIFLYAFVTGLTIRHLGERFQQSNETISL